MCSPFSCTGSFKNSKEHDFDHELPTPIKTPNRSKSCRSYSSTRRRKDSQKNPYANQGLEKFSALLEELEAQKQKIYMQKGAQDISSIYFTYTNSDEFKPFVVRVKQRQQQTSDNHDTKNVAKDHKVLMKRDSIKASSASVDEAPVQQRIKKEELPINQNWRTLWSLKLKNCRGRHIFSCFSVTLLLILLLLALFGRSFAIFCTTVAWYLAPTLSTKIAPAQKTNEAIPSRKTAPAQKPNEKNGVPPIRHSSPKKDLHGLTSRKL